MPFKPHPTDPTKVIYKTSEYWIPKPWVGLSQTEIESIVESNTREGGVCSGLNIALEIQMRLREKNGA